FERTIVPAANSTISFLFPFQSTTMFDKINTVFGLWPSTKNSAKPFFLESFTTFGKAVYPLFLLYTVSITIFDLTSCDFNGLAASSQGMAESMCLMESAFSVRVEDI